VASPLDGSLVFGWFGLDMRFGDESVFVNGVRLLTFRELPKADMVDWAAGALKTEDAVLACELAEPTPFRRSPCRDSLSSVWGAAVSVDGMLLSPADEVELALPARDC
jgi:hypothetical protein